jgi:plastocyanin domain-containing protein
VPTPARIWSALAAAAALAAASPALAKPEQSPNAGPPKSAARTRTIEIGVTGSFSPAEIHVKRGERVNLVFTRSTDRTCATSVHMKDLGVNQDLPLNKPVAVPLKVDRAGKYRFACSMDMIAGTLVVD